jgi:predicted DNA-binding transcriptional regulator AlpA
LNDGVQMPPIAVNPLPKPPALPEVGFVRLATVLAVFPVGRSTWWAGVKAGRFPMPVKLGPRVTAWRVEDIRTLLVAISKDESEELHLRFVDRPARCVRRQPNTPSRT